MLGKTAWDYKASLAGPTGTRALQTRCLNNQT
jgi:hypothetical protein